jgi:uncharacterized protein
MFCLGVWLTGSILSSPARAFIGEAPSGVAAENVEFQSRSRANIKGWFIRGQTGAGAVILMHGNRANRLSMLGRARFLADAGFSVLLFDFQAHGESSGDQITFGYLESKDAQAAVDFVRAKAPGERIGVIGVSLGGAAALLASPPLEVNAMVLEEVYSTLDQAATNRLTSRLGGWSRILTPLLTWQFGIRSGVSADALQPIKRVGGIAVPKLFVAGAEDRHTTLEESQRMFAAAAGPKELWIVAGAGHIDLHGVQKEEYERRVLSFFSTHLKQPT